MTGWNLPPGCTQADIDRAAVGELEHDPYGDQPTELDLAQERVAELEAQAKIWEAQVDRLLDQVRQVFPINERLLEELREAQRVIETVLNMLSMGDDAATVRRARIFLTGYFNRGEKDR